jgi:hypothetical protein
METTPQTAPSTIGATNGETKSVATTSAQEVLSSWLRVQALNLGRHTAALRDFQRAEFGTGAEAPSEGHIQAVNRLLAGLRIGLIKRARQMNRLVRSAIMGSRRDLLTPIVTHKHLAHAWVQRLERIWDFYLELFGQRQSQFGPWLLSADRIALDCYQVAYLGIGREKPGPSAAAFLLHVHGIWAGYLQARDSAQTTWARVDPVPPRTVALSSASQSLDAWSNFTRGKPQLAERPRFNSRSPVGDRTTTAPRRIRDGHCESLGSLEQGSVCRFECGAAGRTRSGRFVDGCRRPSPSYLAFLLPNRSPSNALSTRVDECRVAPSNGLQRRSGNVWPHLARHLSQSKSWQFSSEVLTDCFASHGAGSRHAVLPAVLGFGRQVACPGMSVRSKGAADD